MLPVTLQSTDGQRRSPTALGPQSEGSPQVGRQAAARRAPQRPAAAAAWGKNSVSGPAAPADPGGEGLLRLRVEGAPGPRGGA